MDREIVLDKRYFRGLLSINIGGHLSTVSQFTGFRRTKDSKQRLMTDFQKQTNFLKVRRRSVYLVQNTLTDFLLTTSPSEDETEIPSDTYLLSHGVKERIGFDRFIQTVDRVTERPSVILSSEARRIFQRKRLTTFLLLSIIDVKTD